MNIVIRERIHQLRQWMKRNYIGAYIVPTADPHNSEYLPAHWQTREWLSGFTGSAGTLVITTRKAALWTDSRYFLQAEAQLAGTDISLQREKMPGTPTIGEWISANWNEDDPMTVATNDEVDCGAWDEDIRKHMKSKIKHTSDPFAKLWTDRPPMPDGKVEIHPLAWAGESCQQKLERIRQAIREHQAGFILISALDEIAWTLNLRGCDVHCVPVFASYLVVSIRKATLYIEEEKLTEEVREYLKACKVTIRPYTRIRADLHPMISPVLIDPGLNARLRKAIHTWKVANPTPVSLMKCVKNATEQEGYRKAMLRDGVAMVKFLRWLKPAVQAGAETEMSIDRKLTSLRAEQEGFRGISFDTIAGYGPHAAIVHYEATPETDAALRPEGLLLLDSGGHYNEGTTDITRTISLGPVTPEEKRDYTLVLKGFLRLQNAVFPEGTCGTQLDALAHEHLWRYGQNYMHGTGHGVGSYLSVHEGPHQIRSNYMPAPLKVGMTVTDEPGLYQAGRHGIRIENTLLIVPAMTTEYGQFLKFDPLTLCPIDTAPIDFSLLTAEEVEWFNNYHDLVRQRLSPQLDEAEREWLEEATRPIHL